MIFFNKVIMIILAVFFVLGAIDRVLGCKFGVGKEFERAFSLMGSLALSIVGLFSISPVLANILEPLVVPAYEFFGADAAMFASTFLSVDVGGYSIAMELAANRQIGLFSGTVVASLIGAVMCFTIPVAVGLIEKQDNKYFALGIMSGFISSPIGALGGGIVSGLAPRVVLINLLPVTIVAAFVVIGLIFCPNKMIQGFLSFARAITIVVSIGLALAVFENLTGIVLVKGMNPISDGMKIVGSVIVVLAGAMAFIYMTMKFLKKPLENLGNATGINDASILGIFLSLATIVPVFASYKNMNTKGKVIVAAFAGSTANMFGAHLGYISSVAQDMILPMFSGKILAGIIALPLAAVLYKKIFLPKETRANQVETCASE